METNAEDICRLLAVGTDVISTTSYNHLPADGCADPWEQLSDGPHGSLEAALEEAALIEAHADGLAKAPVRAAEVLDRLMPCFATQRRKRLRR